MTKSRTYQSAQIGVIAVLLTAVLLAIGISISTRVVEQTQQELSRQESAQQFQQAESGADMGGDPMTDASGNQIEGTGVGSIPTIGNAPIGETNQELRQQTYSSDIDTVYLLQGDTVELAYNSNLGNGVISWELAENNTTALDCKERPSLLVTLIDGNNKIILPFMPNLADDASCIALGSPVVGYFQAGSTPPTGTTNTYEKYKSFVTDKSGSISNLASLIDENPPLLSSSNTLKVRIEALYAPTYVYLPGLTSTTRSVSSNQVGNESRVVEQNTTNLAPSYVTDFTIFAGNSKICQGDSNGCN